MGRKNLNLILILLVGIAFFNSKALGATEEEEQKEQQASRPRKFLTLIIGIDYDEKLPAISKKFKAGGDCKHLHIVEVGYSEEINSLRFTPKKEGNCVYTLKDLHNEKILAEYSVTIRKSKQDAVLHEIQSLLGDIEGINFKVINNKVVVDGQILLPRDMNRIYSVISQFGDQASSLVTLSPLAQKKIAEFIARDINNPEIEVRAVNDKFILQGVAANEDERTRAEIIAKTYVPALVLEKAEVDGVVKKPKPANDGVINLLTIKEATPPAPEKTIQLIIHYVELNKNYAKGFNFQFTPSLNDQSGAKFSFGSGGQDGGATTQITGIISNFIPKLNWAKSHGHARVLESTSMIVSDGKQGKIDSSTDFPYQIVTQQGPSVQFKKVGIVSTITPTIIGQRSDTIRMGIDFHIDALNGSIGGAPLTSTNLVNTEIIVRSGQSAAIGGLIKSQNMVNYNSPDNLPKNPIISLYASKDFTRNQSQFVVFVTPIIKSSASAGSEKIKKKFRLRD